MTERTSPLNSPASPLPPCGSPPPKCAICLGSFTNKCFSDSCRHQFCFTCLLEWSKVKAECPLCKQPFKTIIHNIKADEQYDVHVVTPNVPEARELLDADEFLYLPPTPSRHFQFRTTFTVDPGGELAIQQMLLSHPLTNNTMFDMHGSYYRHSNSRFNRLGRSRRASSVTSFRRSIYDLNLWVYAVSELTPYRDISPNYFRDNPTQRNRLVPWLNRELNALLRENTQQVMHLVDVIMDHLPRYHIRTRSFFNILYPYLNDKTDHFIHEFYNFMRSPYDMITYDRQIIYIERHQLPTYLISDPEDNDSDVTIVNITEPVTANNNPFQSPTIEVIEINSDSSHDSDVIIGETPAPEIVNLVDSDTSDNQIPPQGNNCSDSENEANHKPILPLKIRFKRKRQSRERRSHNRRSRRSHYHRSSSSSSTSSSSSESLTDSSSSSLSSREYKKSKRKHKHKRSRRNKNHKRRINHEKEKFKNRIQHLSRHHDIFSFSSDEELSSQRTNFSTFDTEDDLPLSTIRKDLARNPESANNLTERDQPGSSKQTVTFSCITDSSQNSTNNEVEPKPSCSLWNPAAELDNFSGNLACYSPLRSLTNTTVAPSPVCSSESSENDRNTPSYSNLHYPPSTIFNSCSYDPSMPSVGARYYDGPEFINCSRSRSYTPPPTMYSNDIPMAIPCTSNSNASNSRNLNFSNVNCSFYNLSGDFSNQERPPYSMPMDGRTAPIKNEVNTSSYSSTSIKIPSVIVKREGQSQLYSCSYTLPSDSSDA